MVTKVSSSNLSTAVVTTLTGPAITNLQYLDNSFNITDDTALPLVGGYALITGSNFINGCQVTVDNQVATSVTYISNTQVRVQVPSKASGTYVLYVINPDGNIAIRVFGINYSSTPVWSGEQSFVQASGDISIQLSATSDTNVIYSVSSGSTIPEGLTLSSSGLLSGTLNPESDTTYNFNIDAIDNELQETSRSFSIAVSVGDQYWKYTTLLLNGETSSTPFIDDASPNNNQLTIAGDTKPTSFNPYRQGYYSNYCDGVGDYVVFPSANTTLGTNNFTIEFWFNRVSYGGAYDILTNLAYSTNNGAYTAIQIQQGGSGGTFLVGNGSNAWSVNIAITAPPIGVWAHYVLVRSGNTFSAYINGVRQGTATSAVSIPATAAGIQIGYSYYGAVSTTNGYFSNYRVLNGTAAYDPSATTITVPTAPFTATADTVLLTCQSNQFIDNSANNFLPTMSGNISIASTHPFNAPLTSLGSAYFDGTGDYLTLTGVNLSSTDFTIECWVYFTGFGGGAPHIFNFGTNASNRYNAWRNNSTGKFSFTTANGGTYDVKDGTTSPVIGRWYHVALVSNSGTRTMYINGIAEVTSTSAINSGTNWAIGNMQFSGSDFMVGYISDFRVINGSALYTSTFVPPIAPLTPVSNTQLLTLQYNGAATNSGFVDQSNFNHNVVRFGNTTQGSFSPYSPTGWSYYFNGSTDVINTSTSSSYGIVANDFSLEGWAMFTGTFGTAAGFIANFYQQIAGDYGIHIGINSSGYPFTYLQNGNSGGQQITLTGTTLISIGKWTHYVAVRNGANFSLFVDGVRVATSAVAGVVQPSHNVVTLGRYSSNNGALWWKGYISNARMCIGTTPYSANATTIEVPSGPLLYTASTVYLSAQTNRFVDNSRINATLTVSGTPSVQAISPFRGLISTPISYSNYFDGTGDYLTVTGTALDASTATDYTVEFWMHTVKTPTAQMIYELGVGVTNDLQIYVNSSGLTFQADGNASTAVLFLDNTWVHVACVKTGTTLTTYINGVGTTVDTGVTVTSKTIAYIGMRAGSSLPFTGYISNMRVTRAAVYTGNFTPSTTPLTAIANTSLLSCQSATMVDNSTNNFTITVAADAKPKSFNPFGETLTSNVTYSPSVHGGSAYFDGTGDYLAITTSDVVKTWWGTGVYFSVDYWVYPTTTIIQADSSTSVIIGNMIGNAGGMYWSFGPITNGTVKFYYYTSSGQSLSTTATIAINQWSHLAFTNNNGALTIYINGVVSATGTISGTPQIATSTPLTVGAANNYYFTGYVANLRINKGTQTYSSSFVPPTTPPTTIYPSSILLNFTNGGIVDYHSSHNLETAGNTQLSTSVTKYGNSSIYFDGTGDYAIVSGNTANFALGSADFTIELWVYLVTITGGCLILDFRPTSTSGLYPTLYVPNGTTTIAYYTNGADRIVSASGVISANTWLHIALVRASGSTKLYVGGTQVGSTLADTNVYLGAANRPVIAASGIDLTSNMNGYIDDLRITRGYARYTANFTPPTSAVQTK